MADALSALSQQQISDLTSAAAQFDVDPRLLAAVYAKESSSGTNPSGIGASDPFHAFGLISGPGAYNGYGYSSTQNTFADAAKTVAAFFHYERTQFDASHPQGETFLQYADAVYSPPAANPNSLTNLKNAFASMGGDPSTEAHYFSNPLDQWWTQTGQPSAEKAASDPVAAAGSAFSLSIGKDAKQTIDAWLLNAGAIAVFLALLAGAFALLASTSTGQTVTKAALA